MFKKKLLFRFLKIVTNFVAAACKVSQLTLSVIEKHREGKLMVNQTVCVRLYLCKA